MGSNTDKKPWTNLKNSYKNLSKEIKSDNFCYCKVGRAITKWGAIEKRVTKIFRTLMVAIIFLPTVHTIHDSQISEMLKTWNNKIL